MDDNNYYPKKGTQLFKSIVGDWHNVCLDPFGDNWWNYIIGYKDAADVLVEYYGYRKFGSKYIVYPIIFLYRHFLELLLKLIIKNGKEIGYQLLRDFNKYGSCHNIDTLWKECKNIILIRWPNEPNDPVEAVEECIQQFMEIDPTSTHFRYPFLKDGSHSLPESLTNINLRNLSENMTVIGNFLSGICDDLSIELGYREDHENDFS